VKGAGFEPSREPSKTAPFANPQRVRHPQEKVQRHKQRQITPALTTSVLLFAFIMDQEEEKCAMCRNFETAAMQKVGHPPQVATLRWIVNS
jgi:hypothetical protein